MCTCSTAQLLEPFCREYDIRVSVLGSDIDGRTTSTIHPTMQHATTPTVSSGSGGELADPPGLYEKVLYIILCMFNDVIMYRLNIYCLNGFVIFINLD